MPTATTAQDLDLIAPGSRVVVRDLEWQVVDVERLAMGTRAIVRCVGRSELVRDQPAAFYSDLDLIEPEDPTRTAFRVDTSPNGIETRLVLESVVRRTPVPISNTSLTVGQVAPRVARPSTSPDSRLSGLPSGTAPVRFVPPRDGLSRDEPRPGARPFRD